jgi:hypothetical protein
VTKSAKFWRIVVAIVVVVAMLLVLVVLLNRSDGSNSVEPRSARELLKVLNVREPEQDGTYDREKLFASWRDADGNCLNTRNEVLKRDSLSDTNVGCDIEDGEWVSLYDGLTITSAAELEIDHLVALKEAWVSGAWQWTKERRDAFANDLGYLGSLVAVSVESHRPKREFDPGKWLPEKGVCEFVEHWVAVKWRWGLAVDSVERRAILDVLQGNCGERPLAVDIYSAK